MSDAVRREEPAAAGADGRRQVEAEGLAGTGYRLPKPADHLRSKQPPGGLPVIRREQLRQNGVDRSSRSKKAGMTGDAAQGMGVFIVDLGIYQMAPPCTFFGGRVNGRQRRRPAIDEKQGSGLQGCIDLLRQEPVDPLAGSAFHDPL